MKKEDEKVKKEDEKVKKENEKVKKEDEKVKKEVKKEDEEKEDEVKKEGDEVKVKKEDEVKVKKEDEVKKEVKKEEENENLLNKKRRKDEDECCNKVNEKNLAYHKIAIHKQIPPGAKSAIRAVIKKKLETINNMFIDIKHIKEYEGYNQYKDDNDIANYFMKAEKVSEMLKSEFTDFALGENRTNLKKK